MDFLKQVHLVHYDNESLRARLNAQTKACLTEDGPKRTFIEFVDWVLLQNGSPFTISERKKDSIAPAVHPIHPSVTIQSNFALIVDKEPEYNTDRETQQMPVTDPVPEPVPAMEPEPAASFIQESVAISCALAHGTFLADICKAAGLTTPNTLARFYKLWVKPVSSCLLGTNR